MTDLDNQLAEFTDRLLANPQYEKGGEMSKEDRIVLQLHQIVRPDLGLDAAARRRMTQRLTQEWESTHRSRTRQLKITHLRPRQWYTLAAAAVVAALIGLTFVLNGNGNSSASDQTATVTDGPVYFVIGFMVAGILFGAFFYWWSSKQR